MEKNLELLLAKVGVFLREEHPDNFEINISFDNSRRMQRLIEMRDAWSRYERYIGKHNARDGASRTAVEA